MLVVMMWFLKSQFRKEQDGKEKEEPMGLGREMSKSLMPRVNGLQMTRSLLTLD
jgi:hypothetical protein